MYNQSTGMSGGSSVGLFGKIFAILLNWRKLSILILILIFILLLLNPLIESIKQKSIMPISEVLIGKVVSNDYYLYESVNEFKEYMIGETSFWGYLKHYANIFSAIYLFGFMLYCLYKLGTWGNASIGIGAVVLVILLVISLQTNYYLQNDIKDNNFLLGWRTLIPAVFDGTLTSPILSSANHIPILKDKINYGSNTTVQSNQTNNPITI